MPGSGSALADQQARTSNLGALPTPGVVGGFGAGRALTTGGNRPTAKPDAELRLAEKSQAKDVRDERAETKSATSTEAPAALYFNPQLTTDTEGRAKVRFVMPTVESEYRLMIDALGSNRIGSRQDILVCTPAAQAAASPAAAKPPMP